MRRRLPPSLPFLHPVALIATWGGSGLLPKAPGTWGSLAALPFAWVIAGWADWWGLVAAATVLFGIGWWAANSYIRRAEIEDPGAIVVDEVVGQFLVLAVAPRELDWYCAAFVLFRIFDMAKPWPISWADRAIKGGLGTMVDDVLAAIFAAVILAGAMMAVPVWVE